MPSYADCTAVSPQCPVEATTYGYYPNFAGNVFFTVFFGVLGVFQVGLGVYFRTWTFMTALGVGALMEMAGYVGRILMNANPWNESAFKLQIVCLVLAPTFVAAGVYLTLKHIVLNLGPEHSRLKPRLFTWIFISCDVGSLILQAAGGGVAAAAGHDDQKLLKAGDDIIIAGIAFQVVTMAVCGILGLNFFWNVWRKGNGFVGEKNLNDPTPAISPRRMKMIVVAEIFAYFTVLIRCIYRIPEMAGGWGSALMQKENEFLVLDGMMIALGVLAFTLCHPGLFIPSMRTGHQQ
ncbi:hypothetical protein N7462_008174 [Penicillium macrosclerotiorum]|uniref:uncharacterized protein n=1 Tax=Penicillium macrosclerotiorum TaxID=303699 RepID=UPI0025472F8F|nr:uncharacterized protein N7462_008174 [Penicillium macrosclerotiorum]KAJ5679930.1 hypothetical protein N7462_008174 [Penicillium macrosclerotiorum]